LPTPNDLPCFPLDHVRRVKEGEVAFIEQGKDAQQVLEAYGAFGNIVLGAYNPDAHKAGMIYIDSQTSTEQIEAFLQAAKKDLATGHPVELHLQGGQYTDNDRLSQLLVRIDSEKEHFALKTFPSDWGRQSNGSIAIGNNGEVFDELPRRDDVFYPRATQQKIDAPAAEEAKKPEKLGEEAVPAGKPVSFSPADPSHIENGLVNLPQRPKGAKTSFLG
jgi:hypothetical protein